MQDPAFRQWLTQTSWSLCVRYCKVVVWLLPPAALAMDLPLLFSGGPAAIAKLWGLLAWQLAAMAASAGVLAADRWLPQCRSREACLYACCIAFMALVTWIGARSLLHGGSGILIYAAGCTFIAAVIVTPLPVRQPLYALSLVALAATLSQTGAASTEILNSVINASCVVVLCLAIDRHTHARALELYAERQTSERERMRADEVLSNVLPPAVAEELKRKGRVQPRKIDNLGVLFADIAGFTRYANRLPPDALVLVLDQIFSSFDLLVQRHGVEKIKTIGDAYMVVSAGRLPPLCALALDMREALDRYNAANGTQLAMRIGIHAGPAVAGVLGVQRFLYDVWGDTVNVASRLEAAGEPGGIQVSEAVVRQAADFSFGARGLVELQGRGRMLTWWLLAPARAQLPTRELAAA